MHRSPVFLALLASVLPAQWSAIDAVPRVVQFSGFETGDLTEYWDLSVTTGTSLEVQSAVVRGGDYALRAAAVGDGFSYATMFAEYPDGSTGRDLDIADLYVSFWFRYSSATERSRLCEVGGVLGATKASVELETDRRLSVCDWLLTHRTYTTSALAPDRWYRIRWYVGTGLVAGMMLMIDDSVEIKTSTAALSTEAARRVHLGRTTTFGGSYEFFFDDLVISTHGFAPDAEVTFLKPDSAGSYTDWRGTYTDTDDWPHDGDLTFAASTGPRTAVTFGLQDTAAVGIRHPILAVKHIAVLRREFLASAPAQLRLVTGGVVHDAATAFLETDYELFAVVNARDPATARAWTAAGIDQLEVGAVTGGYGPPTRMTAVGAAVLHLRP